MTNRSLAQEAEEPGPEGHPSRSDLLLSAMELLDFPEVRSRVAGVTSFPAARDLALRMSPSSSVSEVERLKRETAEAVEILADTGSLDFHAPGEAGSWITRASLEGTLSGMELLGVAAVLDTLWRARSAILRSRDRAPLLAAMADGIEDFRDLRRRIESSIGSRGEVLDSATPVLGPLRQQVRDAYQRVTDELSRIIASPTGQEALQDQVVSVRGERLVVQVRVEMRDRVPGIVHDASNSGATLFVEPLATVGLCNAWRELALEEGRETARVLADLSTQVGDLAVEIHRGIDATARLDFILARARYSASIGGVATRTDRSPSPQDLRLLEARHPLLEREAVPVTITLSARSRVLVITGPNTGGKTVAMKTVGLMALMSQSGLQIPAAEGSQLPVYDAVYADIGDQQSIQTSVSTFSSHMSNVIEILSQATSASLVLLDELGTGTDPDEGSALAKAILAHLASEGATTVVTTHHRNVAAFAEATPGVTNASFDLDPVTLQPTYRLTMGVPGRSYAMAVASSLGLPKEIFEAAQSLLEPQHLRFEDWLTELQKERHRLQQRLQEAEEARAGAEALSQDLETRLADLEVQKDDIRDALRAELVQRYESVRKALRRAESAISWGASTGDVNEAQEELSSAAGRLAEVEAARPPSSPRPGNGVLAVGDVVEVRGINVRGTVVSMPGQGREAEVAIGDVRLRMDLRRLSRVDDLPEPAEAAVGLDLQPALGTTELDVRGERAQEALLRLEQFLDRAVRDGLSSVRIIHGRGTGALRSAVREYLTHHELSKSYAPEPRERGGDGVTVVELV